MQQQRSVIALCDDDKGFLGAFLPQLKAALSQLHKECEVLCYESTEKLLSDIRNGKKPSILMMDVMLDSSDGMAMARELRKDTVELPVIFMSNNREGALYGYELNALRYLAKPVEKERLLEALRAAIQKQQARTLALQGVEGLFRLEIGSIHYAEMQGRGVQFHLRNGAVVKTRLKISDVEQMLPKEHFSRCHQGYIVNMDAISVILRADVVLDDGCHIPVSRYRLPALRQQFLSYLSDP